MPKQTFHYSGFIANILGVTYYHGVITDWVQPLNSEKNYDALRSRIAKDNSVNRNSLVITSLTLVYSAPAAANL